MIKWWLNSKARKYSKYVFLVGIPVVLFGFGIQIVVAGITSHAVDEAKAGTSSKLMNDPNQEVTGGIANVGGVSGLGAPMSATSGGYSGSSGRGTATDISAVTAIAVELTSIDGNQIRFVYFDIACTGKLTTDAVASLKSVTSIKPGTELKLTVNKSEIQSGLKASNGKTANLGTVLLVQNF